MHEWEDLLLHSRLKWCSRIEFLGKVDVEPVLEGGGIVFAVRLLLERFFFFKQRNLVVIRGELAVLSRPEFLLIWKRSFKSREAGMKKITSNWWEGHSEFYSVFFYSCFLMYRWQNSLSKYSFLIGWKSQEKCHCRFPWNSSRTLTKLCGLSWKKQNKTKQSTARVKSCTSAKLWRRSTKAHKDEDTRRQGWDKKIKK